MKNESNENLEQFDPNAPGRKGKLFGLPHTKDQSELIIIPIPWEVTVTSGTGTSMAPSAILDASGEVDLFSKEIMDVWRPGITLLDIPEEIQKENEKVRALAIQHIRALEQGEVSDTKIITSKVNEASENLNIYVKTTAQKLLQEGKMVGLLGGDHSTPLGLIRALSERYERFGILQVDAHADLRRSYEGFTYSHASIMFNVLKLPAVSKLVQVGIRDYCEEESTVMQRAMGRVKTFFDDDMKEAFYSGKTWDNICKEIIHELPDLVYISFDIDGLTPDHCPNTGTPVPGGMDFSQVKFLLKQLATSGKKIIGFDLCEVSGKSEWDATVGARVLFELSNWMAVSNKKLQLRKS
jgi:agmatinase